MKKIFLKIVIGVVLVCILFVCFLYTNNEIGVTSSKLEADIRSSQKIKDDWTVDGSVSSTMAAYISYPQDLSDHSFSVYVNRPGLSFGYFFRGGGNLSGVQRGIAEYTCAASASTVWPSGVMSTEVMRPSEPKPWATEADCTSPS